MSAGGGAYPPLAGCAWMNQGQIAVLWNEEGLCGLLKETPAA